MKIINLKTNIIFDLPKADAEQLLSVSPALFAQLNEENEIIKNTNIELQENTLLSKILDNE